MQWTAENPGAGDVLGVRSQAVRLQTLADQIADFYSRLASASYLQAPLSSQAISAFTQNADALKMKIGQLSGPINDYAAAMRAYASAVQSIQERAESCRTRIDAAQDAMCRNAAPLPGLGSGAGAGSGSGLRFGLGQSDPSGHAAQAEARRKARYNEAQHEKLAAERDLAALAEERRGADGVLTAALATFTVGTFHTSGVSLAAAGITSAAQVNVDDITDALLDATDALLDGASEEEIAAFVALLGQFANDPQTADAYLRALGAAQFSDVLYRLDIAAGQPPETSPAAVEALELLRSTLSSASRVWEQAYATEFSAGLLGNEFAALNVAYLFGDPQGAPMSSVLALAMGDAVQQWETDNNRLLTWTSLSGASAMAASLDSGMRTDSGSLVLDAADSVFRQIALDPRAALDWLSDSDRTTYWYQTRDWQAGMGFAAPLIVWEALQTIPGALIDDGANPDLVRQLAEVNTTILQAWLTNPSRPEGDLGPEATLALAGVVGAQLPTWLETTLMKKTSEEQPDLAWSLLTFMGEDGWGWTCQISKNDLSTLMTYIARDEIASDRLRDAAVDLQARLVASLGRSEQVDYTGTLERCAAVLGAIEGGRLAADLSDGARADKVMRAGIDALSAAADPATTYLGFPARLAQYGAEEMASQEWASSYQDRLNELWSGTGTDVGRTQQARDAIDEIANGWVPVETTTADGQDNNSYLDGVMNQFDLHYGLLTESKTQ